MNTNHRFSPEYQTGLTTEEVTHQQEAGLMNVATNRITKTTKQIIKDNVCTLFNLFNVLIALALIAVGAFSNLFFILIIVLNTAIGIFQEIHARNLVDRLSLISAPQARVVRNSKEEDILLEEIVRDDIILYDAGRQITADAILLHGTIEVNESMLTGESNPILKETGDLVLSGSFVISGKCYAKVEHVGAQNYAASIALQAKKHKVVQSELLLSMRKITRYTTFLILPIGLLLLLEATLLRNSLVQEAVVSTSAALLGMLPKGLMLLITISLAAGVIKLSKKEVLVQELFALETLAHVDTLCLDKTGTITEGKMSVQAVYAAGSMDRLPLPFDELMGAFVSHSDDNNATFLAMKDHFAPNTNLTAVSQVPFSSQRKWSSVTFENVGTVVIGAPDRLSTRPLPAQVEADQEAGARVLLMGFTTDPVIESKTPAVTAMALLSIADPVREKAPETLAYFQREGVEIKVISGDNPLTVAGIGKKSGLPHYESFIDMTDHQEPEEWPELVETYTIFGRVSPQQKAGLIQAMQGLGHTVAMTGDGVNDVLALREADCSIAFAEGSDAARQASQLVLLNSDFSSLPAVMNEGRRVVNNVTRMASVFFVKTIYSVLVSLLCIFTNTPFPFIPIQITLIDLAIEGYPAFFMSFEPDSRKLTGKFLPTVFRRATPNAIVILLDVILVLFLYSPLTNSNPLVSITLLYCLVAFVDMLAVYRASIPLNPLRIFLCSTMTVGFYVALILFHSIIEVVPLGAGAIAALLLFAAISLGLERLFASLTEKLMKKQNFIHSKE